MNVLICGAGIAGLALGWCLERRGHRPLIVERSPHLRDEGYMMDFFGSGYDAAERLGLLPDLARIHYPIERLAFVDGDGHERFSLPYAVLRRRLFADRHLNFMRGDFERVLYNRFGGRDAIRFGTTVTGFEQDDEGVRVTLSDGTVEGVDLLIGADGIHSRVRRLAFGEEAQFARIFDYHMASFLLDERPAAVPPDVFETLTLPNRQLSIYPIRGGRMAAFFLYKAREKPDDMSTASAHAELQRVFGDLRWVVPDLLERSRSAAVYFDVVQQIAMTRWSDGRVVLIGDACQCVSPLAGQGASMALTAAYVLAEELDGAGLPAAAVARYEQRLQPAIARQQKAARRIAKWFVPDDALHLVLRDFFTRAAAWPVVAPVIRRRMAAQSIFRSRA